METRTKLPLAEGKRSCITPRQVDREPESEYTYLKAHVVLKAFYVIFYFYQKRLLSASVH